MASGVQAKKNTMSAPVKYGEAWKLTVKNSPNDSAMPATAATRVQSPTSVPMPMASSPRAITQPTNGATWTSPPTSPWIGLTREAPTS